MAVRNQLGDLLVRSGVIDDLQLRSARAHLDRWGGRLTGAISEMGLAADDDVAAALARTLRIEVAKLEGIKADPIALSRLPVTFCEPRGIFPIAMGEQNRTMQLAMVDPTDLGTIDEAAALARGRILPLVAGEEDIVRALSLHYRGIQLPKNASRRRASAPAPMEPPPAELRPPEPQMFQTTATVNAEAQGAVLRPPPSTGTMLETMLRSAEESGGWTDSQRSRLDVLLNHQEKSTRILDALLELMVDKGVMRNSALTSWRAGEPLPPLRHLHPVG